jgi:DNA-binding LacI/PurR family transcriptional regulator
VSESSGTESRVSDSVQAEPPLGRPARLIDVARAAGVHVSTASRVINRTGTLVIRPATRQRILDVAEQLQYRPNAIARGLKTATAGAVGLLVPSLRNPVLSDIIRAAFDRAWERGYVVLLAEDGGDSTAVSAYERLVGEGRIDGVLVASARPGNPLLERFAGDFVPCVFVNRRHPGSGRNVSMREEDAGRIAAQHLLKLGHRRLGHLAGPPDLDTASRRREGFVEAATEAGADVVVESAPFEERGGFEAMRRLLGERSRPTGVFVSNINQAVGAMAGARAARRHVPTDLSLVGYDDDPVGEYLEAPLTVVAMPLEELGAAAVDSLIDQIEGAEPRDIVIDTPPRLVVRASTAPPCTESPDG